MAVVSVPTWVTERGAPVAGIVGAPLRLVHLQAGLDQGFDYSVVTLAGLLGLFQRSQRLQPGDLELDCAEV